MVTPMDVTVDRLAIESFYPVGQITAATLHKLPRATGSTAASHS